MGSHICRYCLTCEDHPRKLYPPKCHDPRAEFRLSRSIGVIVANRRNLKLATNTVSMQQLDRALLVSAHLTKRYKGTVFEVASLDLFERLEHERARAEQRASVRRRAESVLNGGVTAKP